MGTKNAHDEPLIINRESTPAGRFRTATHFFWCTLAIISIIFFSQPWPLQLTSRTPTQAAVPKRTTTSTGATNPGTIQTLITGMSNPGTKLTETPCPVGASSKNHPSPLSSLNTARSISVKFGLSSPAHLTNTK